MAQHLVNVFWLLAVLPLTTAFNTIHFHEWFGQFHSTFMSPGTTWLSDANSTPPCEFETSRYWADASNFNCWQVTTCLLDNLGNLAGTAISSASVFLGLLPAVLAGFGPTVAEMSLLSSQRPFLSFLVAFGAPSVYPNRLLDYTPPLSSLDQLPTKLSIRRPSRRYALAISIAQYGRAMAAICNNISASLSLGTKAVLSWSCIGWAYPLGWSLGP